MNIKRKDIESIIGAYQSFINSIIYPNGESNPAYEPAANIYNDSLALIDNANMFSNFVTKKRNGEFGREVAFLTQGACAVGILTCQSVIDHDEKKYQEIYQGSIHIILDPTIKIANRYIDACNNGYKSPLLAYSTYDPKRDFYKRYLDNITKLITQTNLVLIASLEDKS